MISDKTNIFGKEFLKIFNIGDCVSYYETLNSKKNYAIITDICLESIENDKERLAACAMLHTMKGEKFKLLLQLLTLECSSKFKKNKFNEPK